MAHRLNAERAKPPHARGWGPSGIRAMLHRPLYRGESTWNHTKKKEPRPRDRAEWIDRPVPELRIVSDELWQRVKARLEKVERAVPA